MKATGRPLRVLLYARVSTRDQDASSQIHTLREVAQQRGWFIGGEFVDVGVSGGTDRRPQLDAMLKVISKGRADIVACIKIDRLGRSLRHLVTLLDDFRARDIAFVSVSDGLDSSTPTGRLTLGLVAAMAEFERELIRERTRVGLEAARRRGARIGRPPVAIDLVKATRLKADGVAMQAIADACGCGVSTLRRELARGAWAPRRRQSLPTALLPARSKGSKKRPYAVRAIIEVSARLPRRHKPFDFERPV